MNQRPMTDWLKEWQGKIVENRHGVKARVVGLTSDGRLAYLEFVEDSIADEIHPSRVGCTGQALPTSLGTTWN